MRSIITRFALIVAALGAAAPGVAAQTPLQRDVKIGVGAGITAPAGDLADDHSAGAHLRVHADLVTLGRKRAWRAGVAWQELGVDDAGPVSESEIVSLTASMLQRDISARRFKPYLVAGAGAYRRTIRFTRASGLSSDSETGIGLHGGAGVRTYFGAAETFAEIVLHVVAGDDWYAMVPLSVGFSF